MDLFTLMRSHTYAADFAATARQLEIEGVSVGYLAPEALIELKSSSDQTRTASTSPALRAILAGAALPDANDLTELTPPPSEAQEEDSD